MPIGDRFLMKYVILVHEEKDTRQILNLFQSKWFLEYTSEYIYIGRHGNEQTERQYVQIEYCQEWECDLTDEDKVILSKLISPKYSFVRYSDLSFFKLVFSKIAQSIPCYIDNNYDDLFKGSDFDQNYACY